MHHKFLALLLGVASAVPAAAHDVWMQTDRYVVPVGTAVPYRIFVGHGAFREAWNVGHSRIAGMKSIGENSSLELKPSVAEAGVIRFDKPGAYIVAMTSTFANSDLPALRFNEYAKAEGLTAALQLRDRLGQAGQNGRELYTRRTKMLVRVGAVRGAQPVLTRPVGLSLEIVPALDPFTVHRGRALPLSIFYNGRALAGATVKLTNLANDAAPVAIRVTDGQGQVVFAHPGAGNWQFNVIWTRPLIGNRDAEFETTFSSMTFGI